MFVTIALPSPHRPCSWRLVACLALGVLFSGCASRLPLALDPAVTLAPQSVLPAPEAGDFLLPERVFVLGPYDQISVAVYGVAELQRELQIDAGGRFEFPLIGTIDAGGRTAAELAREIEDRLRGRYVKAPQVTINLIEMSSHKVTVDGEVTKPGAYPVYGDMTLMRAVASAEGLSSFADREDVVVFRKVGGQRYAALYNLAAIRRGNYEDPRIYANDVVIVGQSASLRMFDRFARIVPLFTAPIIILANN